MKPRLWHQTKLFCSSLLKTKMTATSHTHTHTLYAHVCSVQCTGSYLMQFCKRITLAWLVSLVAQMAHIVTEQLRCYHLSLFLFVPTVRRNWGVCIRNKDWRMHSVWYSWYMWNTQVEALRKLFLMFPSAQWIVFNYYSHLFYFD